MSGLPAWAVAAGLATAADPDAFFESKVRPVLAAHCLDCHSAAKGKTKGGLALDTREGVRAGGDRGPAVVPGDPDKSLLVKAVRHRDKDLAMPPKGRLPADAVAALEQWVKMGAPDPRDGQARKPKEPAAKTDHWAFQKPVKHTPPPGGGDPIDRFLSAARRAKGLSATPEADRRTLLRRLSFDLTGLPPTPEEVAAFVNDTSADAYDKLVDRLLKSPAFGERWGRHWLDVARYAESTGRQVNHNFPHAWRYRDYVIDAFNADKPFDRFVREQLAGDLLPAADDRQRAGQTVATGYLALGPKALNERNSLQFEMDVADEQIDATTQAFLGVTVACARCHDHKFDPVPMADYYALAGVFRSTETCYGTVRLVQAQRPSALLLLPASAGVAPGLEKLSDGERRRLKGQADGTGGFGRLFAGKDAMGFIRQRILQGTARAKLDLYESDGTPKLRAMGTRERTRPVDSPVFARGEVDKPGERVARGLPKSLGLAPPAVTSGSGRRELADWVASPDNPLTARVFVNRVWLHLFGRGLVPTPDNFGTAGQPPTHPELLDWLAVAFVEDGWSVKQLVRRLVLTAAYRQGSRPDPAAVEADPDNTLVWRMSSRRLDAEALRDAVLAVSGRLDPTPPRGSAVTRAGDGYTQGFLRFGGSYLETYRGRSVYLPVLRDALPEALALFDAADPSTVVAERPTTTVPAQGLFLLNSPLVMKASEAAAARLTGDDDARLRAAYELFYARPPAADEVAAGREFLSAYEAKAGRAAAWAALCQAMFASAEFLYVR